MAKSIIKTINFLQYIPIKKENYQLVQEVIKDDTGFVLHPDAKYEMEDYTNMMWYIDNDTILYEDIKWSSSFSNKIFKSKYYEKSIYAGTEIVVVLCICIDKSKKIKIFSQKYKYEGKFADEINNHSLEYKINKYFLKNVFRQNDAFQKLFDDTGYKGDKNISYNYSNYLSYEWYIENNTIHYIESSTLEITELTIPILKMGNETSVYEGKEIVVIHSEKGILFFLQKKCISSQIVEERKNSLRLKKFTYYKKPQKKVLLINEKNNRSKEFSLYKSVYTIDEKQIGESSNIEAFQAENNLATQNEFEHKIQMTLKDGFVFLENSLFNQDFLNAIADLKMPNSLLFTEKNNNSDTQIISHFGGIPYFEKDEKWPLDDDDENRMDFVCQIFNSPKINLPQEIKLIQLFTSATATCYDEDEVLIKIYNELNFDTISKPDGNVVENCYAINFQESCDYPSWNIAKKANKNLSKLFKNFEDKESVYDALLEENIGTISSEGKIGGYPNWVQYEENFKNYIFLFQLDSSNVMQWGDAGSVYIFYNPTSKKTKLIFQSH